MLDDASSIPSFIIIHSHLLDGITTSASSLPPFLPASDPRLPDARQGKVLSLHHLEGRSYTYKDTQLLRYNDLNRSSPVSKIPFRANGSHTPIAPDPASPVGYAARNRNLKCRLIILKVQKRRAGEYLVVRLDIKTSGQNYPKIATQKFMHRQYE